MKAAACHREQVPLRSILLCGLLTLASGCASVYEESLTYKLWNNESFRNFNEPATDPQLQFYVDRSRSDVLVEYDEVRERDGAIHRRAFFVNANASRIDAGLKPRFVSIKKASTLKPVRLLHAESGEPVPPSGFCVVVEPNKQHFTMYSDGKYLSAVTLPTYGTTGGMKKSLLTPLTVTGDTLAVGVIAGIVVAHSWAHNGYHGYDCR